jgi:hypothetical protein
VLVKTGPRRGISIAALEAAADAAPAAQRGRDRPPPGPRGTIGRRPVAVMPACSKGAPPTP